MKKNEIATLKIAYVLWDFPSLSQTFVLNEIHALVIEGFDIRVYYKTEPEQKAILDFSVDSFKIRTENELAQLLKEHNRTIIHSHFAYPCTTQLAYPAAKLTSMPFTFTCLGVDVTHYENQKRNRVRDISCSELCLKVFTLGSTYCDILVRAGVPREKIVIVGQSVPLLQYKNIVPMYITHNEYRPKVRCIARFVEKKGLKYLIEAAAMLQNLDFYLHGYGPLEDELKELVNILKLQNVFFSGLINNRQGLIEAYCNTDIFALPCIRSTSGDMDGMPTVLLEAMSAGVPVVTTDAGNICDLVKDEYSGFVCEQAKVDSLVLAIERLLNFNSQKLQRLLDNARYMVEMYCDKMSTKRILVDIWSNRTIDIFLVTYDKGNHKNWNDTFEIIHRVIRFTTLDFRLIVVDNDSDDDFKQKLVACYGNDSRIQFVFESSNLYCCKASNIAIRKGLSDYVVYLCSKEGFILQYQWDLKLTRYMDENTEVGIGGHLVSLPRFSTGKTLINHPDFNKFRNPQFALQNPSRVFRHVQGGVYILRREAFENAGGFNEQLLQDNMDVEYSFYLESCGWKLGQVPNIKSITVKTRPSLHCLVDESSILVHPLTAKTVSRYDSITRGGNKACNVCGWVGKEFSQNTDSECPQCNSTRFTRSSLRYLAQSTLLQNKPKVILCAHDRSMESALRSVTPFVNNMPTAMDLLKYLQTDYPTQQDLDLLIIQDALVESNTLDELTFWLSFCLDAGIHILLGNITARGYDISLPQNDYTPFLIDRLASTGYPCHFIRLSSFSVGYSWKRIAMIGKDLN